ncbi:hypothetical protein H5410_000929, partial [Solanum commersonii]
NQHGRRSIAKVDKEVVERTNPTKLRSGIQISTQADHDIHTLLGQIKISMDWGTKRVGGNNSQAKEIQTRDSLVGIKRELLKQ